VFHPGHEELHGVTVVVEGPGGITWVGRYHERNDRGVLLHDVATHDLGSAHESRAAWIERLLKFGIRIDQKHVVIPNADATRIVRLPDWKPPGAIVKST
jgi:hypothetical protein